MKSFASQSVAQFAAAALVAVSVGISGCGDAPPPASIPSPETAEHLGNDPVTSSDVKEEVNEAVDAASRYAGQTKDEYQAAMQKKLDELDAKIEELQAKSAAASEEAQDDVKQQYQETMATLKEKRQAAADEFNELKEASGDAWKDFAAGVDAAWNDLSAAFSSAADEFKETGEDAK